MKHQQVVVDYWKMLKTSGLFFLLACSGYVFIKMVQTIFWLPRYLEKNQRRLEELAETYSIKMKEQPVEKIKENLEEQRKVIDEDESDLKKDK